MINLESELCLSNLISSLGESLFSLYFDNCQHLHILHSASNIKILRQSYLQLAVKMLVTPGKRIAVCRKVVMRTL